MNYISINIISFFQVIIRGLLIRFSSLAIAIVFFNVIACEKKLMESKVTAHSSETTVRVEKKYLELDQNKGLVYFEGQPFTGISQIAKNTHVAEQISYVNGRKHGFYKKWFISGALSFEAFYKDGKQEGMTRTWWSNGNLRSESSFKKGIADGVQRQWYKSGAKFKVMNMSHGKEAGIQKAWRENGKIYNNYEAKNDRIFGLKRANLCYELEDEIVQYQ